MGAQILSEIGVKNDTSNKYEWKFIGIEAFDIEIIETQFLNIIDDKKYKFLLVASTFYPKITDGLINGALDEIKNNNFNYDVYKVNGS